MPKKTYCLSDFLKLQEIIVEHLKKGGAFGANALDEARSCIVKTFGIPGQKKVSLPNKTLFPNSLNLPMYYLDVVCELIEELKLLENSDK